jgi:hypothetical protein
MLEDLLHLKEILEVQEHLAQEEAAVEVVVLVPLDSHQTQAQEIMEPQVVVDHLLGLEIVQ